MGNNFSPETVAKVIYDRMNPRFSDLNKETEQVFFSHCQYHLTLFLYSHAFVCLLKKGHSKIFLAYTLNIYIQA